MRRTLRERFHSYEASNALEGTEIIDPEEWARQEKWLKEVLLNEGDGTTADAIRDKRDRLLEHESAPQHPGRGTTAPNQMRDGRKWLRAE